MARDMHPREMRERLEQLAREQREYEMQRAQAEQERLARKERRSPKERREIFRKTDRRTGRDKRR